MRSSVSSVAVLLVAFFLAACGGAAPRGTAAGVATHARPQSLEEGLAARGLRRLTLVAAVREMSYSLDAAPTVADGRVTLTESSGWNAQHSVFAQRDDGTVFLVRAQPTRIVDRHVAGGCRGFAGGRAWFETVSYALPAGATYGGTMPVTYDDHVEITDYSDAMPDGSACPPPAID